MTATTANGLFALVTGGASGLGREYCLQLARDGYSVAVSDISQAGPEETLRLIGQSGGSGRVEICDVSNVDAWRALRARLQAEWPRLDVLVNNAGMYASSHIGALDLGEFERVIRLNLWGVIYGCDTMIPWLIATAEKYRAHCHVINMASIYGLYSPPGMPAYNVSKAGVVSLSETLYAELRGTNVGVTAICPGPIPTRFVDNASFDRPELRQLVEKKVHASRLTPTLVVAAALRGMRRRQLYVPLGFAERCYWYLKRLLPQTFQGGVAWELNRQLKRVKGRESRVESRAPSN
jgi:NAD(P)-dependent dehydrogenase (short-subunit alcohol dehydrogenase family)